MNRPRLIVFIFILFFQFSGSLISDKKPKQVLLLNSYHYGFSWTDGLTKQITSFLDSADKNIKIFIEYMDTKNTRVTDEYFNHLFDLYNIKYKNRPIDLIICSDDDALTFLFKYRNNLFKGVPIVFCGISNSRDSLIRQEGNCTGLYDDIDNSENIRLVLKIFSKIKNIYFIHDQTSSGKSVRKSINDLRGEFPEYNISFLTDMTIDSLLDAVRKLPENTLLFPLLFNIDKEGRTFSHEDFTRILSENTSVPIIASTFLQIGNGAVGGRIIDPEDHSRKAAEMALRILNGESVSNIPIQMIPYQTLVWDYNQLQKHHIDILKLPKQSRIINEPPDFFERYGKVLVPLLFVVFVLITISLFLLLNIFRRRVIEKELRISEKKYRDLVENAHEGIWIISKTGKTIFANQKLAEILGYSLEEILKADADEILQGQTERFIETNMKLWRTGEKGNYEIALIKGDNTEIYCNISISPILYEEKSFIGIYALVSDITQRKIAERNLKISEYRLKAIIQNATDIIFIKDLDKRYILVNQALLDFLGVSEYELIGKKISETESDSDFSNYVESIDNKVLSGEIVHHEYKQVVKGKINFLDSIKFPLFDVNNRIVGICGIVRNVTDKKEASEELHKSQERLELAIKAADLGMWDYYIGTKKMVTNKNYLLIHEILPESASNIVDSFVERLHPEDKQKLGAQLRDHIEGKTPFLSSEYRIKKNNENYKWILAQGKISDFDSEGKAYRITGFCLDITQRKEYEEEMLKIRKLDSIGVLAGGIAHDFNNLLQSILGNISLSKVFLDSYQIPKAIETIEKSEKAVIRAKDLTQQLLTFSKGGTPILKTYSIAELIRESVSFILRGSKSSCELILPDQLYKVEIDPGQINQVINNLVLNADQAMPEGGKIIISAENYTVEGLDQLPLKNGNYVKVEVRDNGIGIPPHLLEKIFDPYFTTKPKGNGLGLSIVFTILNKHNGYIHVSSEIGKGSTFTFYLPTSDKQDSGISKRPDEKISGSGKVLIMDDDEMIRDLLENIMANLGYSTVSVANGQEAYNKYLEEKIKNDPFDLVILDLTIPGGLGGLDTFKLIKKIDDNVNAIISSGYSNDPVMSDFKKLGFSAVLKKPYKIEEIGETISMALKKKINNKNE